MMLHRGGICMSKIRVYELAKELDRSSKVSFTS